MDCDFSPSSPHLLPNGLFSPQNRISFELLALSGLSGFSTFKGGKMLIFQGFANSRIVREFLPFSFKVRIATLTRNAVYVMYLGFESLTLRHNEKRVRTRREQTKSAEENSPVDCFCRRGQGAKRREGARECTEKIPNSPPTDPHKPSVYAGFLYIYCCCKKVRIIYIGEQISM